MIVLANVVWPALYLGGRLFTWWIIAAGLAIEFFFVMWLTKATPTWAGLMTLAMNAVSAAVGIVGIPLAGIVWELIASITIMPLFDWGTFNPVTWFMTCVLAALLNALVETASLRFIFKVAWARRLFWWLALANFVTVGIAMVSIMMKPPKI